MTTQIEEEIMKDYLIWAAERLEKKYKWDYYDAMEYLMSGNHIPYDVSIEKYLKERDEENETLAQGHDQAPSQTAVVGAMA